MSAKAQAKGNQGPGQPSQTFVPETGSEDLGQASQAIMPEEAVEDAPVEATDVSDREVRRCPES